MALRKDTNTILLSDDAMYAFREAVWDYYRTNGRHDLPWRRPGPDGAFDPYAITVSELMLQQTQVSRVIPKFEAFLEAFPTSTDLANASLADVLVSWSGLGYNRRAKFLWQLAGVVRDQYSGQMPQTLAELVRLPGIGPNTAGAILAYAYNQRVTYIETNIRTVYIHHFFADHTEVSDKAIAELVTQTLPPEDEPLYREWYWALMDYGAFLKQTVGNASRVSRHYVRQSAFEGSRRQIRGQVLKLLTAQSYTEEELTRVITDDRLPAVLQDLSDEGFISRHGEHYALRA